MCHWTIAIQCSSRRSQCFCFGNAWSRRLEPHNCLLCVCGALVTHTQCMSIRQSSRMTCRMGLRSCLLDSATAIVLSRPVGSTFEHAIFSVISIVKAEEFQSLDDGVLQVLCIEFVRESANEADRGIGSLVGRFLNLASTNP